MKIKHALTYDDVLLVPQHSNVNSRSEVSLDTGLHRDYYKFPVIPANMKTVVGLEMANAITAVGGLAILHRFASFEEQIETWKAATSTAKSFQVGMSLGVKDDDYNNAVKMIKEGVNVICIDIAHGDSSACVNMCKWLRQAGNDKLVIIAGNVATGDAALRLWNAGATTVKVGIGPGSLCSTRVETGNGVPQLSALMDVAKTRKKFRQHHEHLRHIPMTIIADGGVKSAGDCVKALCFADMVMAGNLFAGTDESPGETVQESGKVYKRYDGSSTHKANHIEGVAAMVPSKGPVANVIQKLSEGIRSGCSYQGVDNLFDLKKNPKFVRVTNAGLKESHPHSVSVIK